MEPTEGFEPTAYGLQIRRSTTKAMSANDGGGGLVPEHQYCPAAKYCAGIPAPPRLRVLPEGQCQGTARAADALLHRPFTRCPESNRISQPIVSTVREGGNAHDNVATEERRQYVGHHPTTDRRRPGITRPTPYRGWRESNRDLCRGPPHMLASQASPNKRAASILPAALSSPLARP